MAQFHAMKEFTNRVELTIPTSTDDSNIGTATNSSILDIATKEDCLPADFETSSANASAASKSSDLLLSSNNKNPSPNPRTIQDLPNELLSHIIGLLQTPRPSQTLNDEPTFELTNSESADLKTASCVSKRWRETTSPMLFKHARISIENLQLNTQMAEFNHHIKLFKNFVKKQNLLNPISTLVILVKDMSNNSWDDLSQLRKDVFADFWVSLFKVVNPVELLLVASPIVLGAFTSCGVFGGDAWNFDSPCHYLRLRRPLTLFNDARSAGAEASRPALTTGATYETIESATSVPGSSDTIPEDLPRRPMLTSVLGNSSEKFTNPTAVADSLINHGISQVEKKPASSGPEHTHQHRSSLFEARPWASILLNEGSFIKAYSTYEFWQRSAPSILSDLLGAGEDSSVALISPTIREMSYIGIFPMASHFSNLTRHMPRLDSLYVQLVPRNNIMDIPSKMIQIETEDLWMERNSCYALLMRELFGAPPTRNYKHLRAFESGDAADKDAWNMAVEYVKRAGNGWNVVGEGVFERDPKDLAPEPEEGAESVDPSSFQGSLIRWAWNGTTKLPISAYSLYDNHLGPVN